MKKGFLVELGIWACIFCMGWTGRAGTYFVDFAGGSDSNNGLSATTAWKHCPGDTNSAGVPKGIALAAGDSVVFKGGVAYVGDIAVKSSGAGGSPITYDGTGSNWGSGRALIDLQNIYYHAFYSNPGRHFITIKGFRISHAKNNNNTQNQTINRNGVDMKGVNYGGNGDVYCEGGIFDMGGTNWVLDGLDISEFENCYDRAILAAETDGDPLSPLEVPCTKAGIYMYNGAHNAVITNCTLWAIGRTAIKFFGATNFVVTDCNIGGADNLTNKGWFAVAVKMSGVGSSGCGPGMVRETKAHDGWQYQGDEAQQRCHAGDWFHLFGDNDGKLESDADVHDILFDRVYCYSDHTFKYMNGTSYYFLESDVYNIEWRNCLMVNSFSGAIEVRDSSNLVVNASTFIDNAGNVPFYVKSGNFMTGPKAVKLRDNVFMTTSANTANTPCGTSGGAYSGPMVDSDYNLYYSPNNGNPAWRWAGVNRPLAAWQTFSGQDIHSRTGDPKLVSIPLAGANSSTGDYHPTSVSPLLGAGEDLSSLFTIDFDGETRQSPWTIGALLQFSTVPPPTNVRVVEKSP